MEFYKNPYSHTRKRHEIKTLLSYPQYVALRARLSGLVTPDPHMPDDNGYLIRSVYFDDLHRSAYMEKDSGVWHRNKFRIRSYNGSDEYLVLENKEKIDDRINKSSLRITRDDYDRMLRGDFSSLLQYDAPLARQVYALHQASGLSPVVVVEYRREAYLHPLSMVRVTFDRAVAAGVNSLDMFDPALITAPIYDRQEVVLEVKYETHYPMHLKTLLQNNGARLAISKFVNCCDWLQAHCILAKALQERLPALNHTQEADASERSPHE